jgi:hypothetical protein
LAAFTDRQEPSLLHKILCTNAHKRMHSNAIQKFQSFSFDVITGY